MPVLECACVSVHIPVCVHAGFFVWFVFKCLFLYLAVLGLS